jgi:BirA family biotin operon repressor/biotin-[acetyl-CoA-carboxylase] ligase
MHFAVIGMGINVNSEVKDFPPHMIEMATSIRIETGREHSRTVLIAGILNEMDYWYHTILMSKGRSAILRRWRDLTATLGKTVRVTLADETLTGIAEDIDKEGMLLVRLPSGAIRTINSGDVSLLR